MAEMINSVTEMIDIYDENRTLTGMTLPRKTRLERGQYMLYVLALIRNSQGKLLITRRALDKKWAAGAWEIPGGGALAGESSVEAVLREVSEETGITIARDAARLIYSYRNDDEKHGDNYFCDIYLCTADFEPDDLKLEKKEAIDVRLAGMEEIGALEKSQGFLHYKRICEALAACSENN